MTTDTQEPRADKRASSGDEVNPASERRWLYGFNAFVLVAMGIAALVLILWMCNNEHVRMHTRWDWSSNGANSLSSSTVKMLKQVDKSGKDFTIISLFTPPTDQDREEKTTGEQSQHRQQINDLLRQYAKNSSHIKVEDQGETAREDIEKRVREKYKGELKPYEDAVKDFDPIATKLEDFLKKEAPRIGAFGQQAGTSPEVVQQAAVLQAAFANAPSELKDLTRSIQHETDATLPQWNVLTGLITSNLQDIRSMFDELSDPAKLKASHWPDVLVKYFTENQQAYKQMATDLKNYNDEITKLPQLKVTDVLNGLDQNTVVILGDTAAKVIASTDIYSTAPQSAQGAKPAETFNGEQAISSALLNMAVPDKVKVVFVTAAPEHLLTDTYSDMQDVLQQNNFDVMEWSPPGPPSPDNPTPPSPTPPAEGKGVVWVVFTPDAPPQQFMMAAGAPDPKPVLEATRKHMAEGGQVLFMADPSSPMSGSSGFPYDELVRSFGIDVQPRYTVYHQIDTTDPDTGEHVNQPTPYIEITRFEKNEITDPIQSLPTVFGPVQTQSGGSAGAATVVGIQKPLPQGVSATVLATTPEGGDYWGESDPLSAPKFDPGSDMASPVPLAAIGVKNKGQKDKDGSSMEQRVAVFGAKMIGANFFLDLNVQFQQGGVRYVAPRFPGNQELMKNTILWLAGYENMIAVSAKVDPAARIGDVSPHELAFIRVGIVALLPLGILLLGGIIWYTRHK